MVEHAGLSGAAVTCEGDTGLEGGVESSNPSSATAASNPASSCQSWTTCCAGVEGTLHASFSLTSGLTAGGCTTSDSPAVLSLRSASEGRCMLPVEGAVQARGDPSHSFNQELLFEMVGRATAIKTTRNSRLFMTTVGWSQTHAVDVCLGTTVKLGGFFGLLTPSASNMHT